TRLWCASVRVALLITCFNDTLFPRTGQAVVRVLERLGHEVDFPLEQTCCGQMHANSGYQLEAVPLVRRFVRVFGAQEAIVCPSGTRRCGCCARGAVSSWSSSPMHASAAASAARSR